MTRNYSFGFWGCVGWEREFGTEVEDEGAVPAVIAAFIFVNQTIKCFLV